MTRLDAEVCVVGARPHGLAVAARLVTASPGATVAARRLTRSSTGIDLDSDAVVRNPVPAS